MLRVRLANAAEEAERWRQAAHELRAFHEAMAEVVLVDLDPSAVESYAACGNSSLRARMPPPPPSHCNATLPLLLLLPLIQGHSNPHCNALHPL